jgi:hypothetical protein
MLRNLHKRHRRHQHTQPEAIVPTTHDGEQRVLEDQPRISGLPRMTWASVVTDRAHDDRPLSRNKDLQIRSLLDDPRLRRAMGLDVFEPELVLVAA